MRQSNNQDNQTKPKKLPLPNMEHKELANSSFWIGQLFMIVATVLGVYLAAQTGLKQAIAFDAITDMQNNFYIRRSLYDELDDNIQIIREYAKLITQNRELDLDPAVDTFVWDTMRDNPNTLQTPPYFLRETRRFYTNSKDIVGKVHEHIFSTSHAAKQLNELADHMEQQVLPKLKMNIAKLEKDLKKNDIELEH